MAAVMLRIHSVTETEFCREANSRSADQNNSRRHRVSPYASGNGSNDKDDPEHSCFR